MIFPFHEFLFFAENTSCIPNPLLTRRYQVHMKLIIFSFHTNSTKLTTSTRTFSSFNRNIVVIYYTPSLFLVLLCPWMNPWHTVVEKSHGHRNNIYIHVWDLSNIYSPMKFMLENWKQKVGPKWKKKSEKWIR